MGPEAFDYTLPAERIAQAPAPRREDARLMVVEADGVAHRTVGELAGVLPEGALVVVNDSRVVPARLFAHRPSPSPSPTSPFELLVIDPDVRGGTVRAWVRGARRLAPGDRLVVGGLVLELQGRDATDSRARVFAVIEGDVLTTCREHGRVPLPPYIERDAGPEDAQRYQTIYADPPGSVAAPTAGLHWSEAMIQAADPVRVTLHVGPGTFMPMEATDVREHRVGRERFEVSARAAERIEAARAAGRPILAVGTTVARVLETVGAPVRATAGATDLVITPGFEFCVVTHLVTNFHLPRSSLLMLACSFAGRERVLRAYEEAVAAGYRFYSYGDAMLLERHAT